MRIKPQKILLNAALIALVLVGVAFLAYPTVSNYHNSKVQSKVINQYNEYSGNADREAFDKIRQKAEKYNESLYSLQSTGQKSENAPSYRDVLSTDKSGVMGYIAIPSIEVQLPIYHGTDSDVLQAGIGHYEGSSVPCGGVNTHAVLMGHTGLPSVKLFDDIDKLTGGDMFELHTGADVLYYRVYETEVVEPQKLDEIGIEQGRDIVTLVTCTPYGVNSHRLLVHGERVPKPSEPTKSDNLPQTGQKSNIIVIILITAGAGLVLAGIILRIRSRKKRK